MPAKAKPTTKAQIMEAVAAAGKAGVSLSAAKKHCTAKHGTKENLVKTFRRGFKAKFGPVKQIERIQGSTVHIRGGGKAPIKQVMAVDKDSSSVPVTFGEFTQRAENKREKTTEFITALQEWLKDEEKSLVKAAEYLKGYYGVDEYERILNSVYGSLADVIRLWEPPLELTKGGYYVRTD